MINRVPAILFSIVALAGALCADEPDAKQFDTQFRPFLDQHCVTCHSGDKPKGKLRLDQLKFELTVTANRQQWDRIVEPLKSG